MKLDPKQLRADADAHAERMASPLWTPLKGEHAKTWLASLTNIEPAGDGAAGPRPGVQEERLDEHAPQSQLRLDALEQMVQKLAETTSRRPAGAKDVLGWLEEAGGNPHTYDAPDGARSGVCVRILPGTYKRLRVVQSRAGLRTRAAAWEFLLRLGLAATERLPRGRPP